MDAGSPLCGLRKDTIPNVNATRHHTELEPGRVCAVVPTTGKGRRKVRGGCASAEAFATAGLAGTTYGQKDKARHEPGRNFQSGGRSTWAPSRREPSMGSTSTDLAGPKMSRSRRRASPSRLEPKATTGWRTTNQPSGRRSASEPGRRGPARPACANLVGVGGWANTNGPERPVPPRGGCSLGPSWSQRSHATEGRDRT